MPASILSIRCTHHPCHLWLGRKRNARGDNGTQTVILEPRVWWSSHRTGFEFPGFPGCDSNDTVGGSAREVAK
jgi:hypothetical protein